MVYEDQACQAAIKITNGSRVHTEGEAIKDQRKRSSLSLGNSQSTSASRMAMANDSTDSVRSSAISDVFIVLFTFLAHLLLAKVISIIAK